MSPLILPPAGLSQATADARYARLLDVGQSVERDYGAVGDGVTDDTTALTNAIAGITTNSVLLFRPGATYKITAALPVPLKTRFTMGSPGYPLAQIVQYTNNTPIFSFQSQDTKDWRIQGLDLRWNTQQTSSNTDSVAVLFNTTSGANAGYYHWMIRDCMLRNGYRGIACSTDVTKMVTLWNSHVHNCRFIDFSSSAIRYNSPIGTGGMPNNYISGLFVGNYGVDNVDPQIYLQNQRNISLRDLDMEESKAGCIYGTVSGGEISNLHTEWTYLSVGSIPSIIYWESGALNVRNLDILSTTIIASGPLYGAVVRIGSGGRVTVEGGVTMENPAGATSVVTGAISLNSKAFVLVDPASGGQVTVNGEQNIKTSGMTIFDPNTQTTVGPRITLQRDVGAVTDIGDASVTNTLVTATHVQRWNTPLTAIREIRLPRSYKGGFRIVRDTGATGAFNLNINTYNAGATIKTLATAGTWADLVFDATNGWRVAASGTV